MKKLGFGAMRLPLTDANDPTSINIEEVKKMVDTFLDAGFTYFDTAYPYHEQKSECAMKEALTDRHDRSAYLFADKMPTILVRSAADYPKFFEEQMQKTGLEYFDYYLMHNMGKDRYAKTEEFDGFAFAEQKKAEGKIRKLGFSFHDDADTLDAILTKHPEVDFIQLQINYLDWMNPVIQSKKCYETAVRHNKPVVVMEPIKGGTLANLPQEAIDLIHDFDPTMTPASLALRFVASLDNVFMILSGMSTLEQVKENTALMSDCKPLNIEEYELLDKIVEIIHKNTEIPCTSCGYCMEVCPKNIAIPSLFGLYNNYKTTGNFSNMYFERMTFSNSKPSECLNCHQCEKNCPQHIQIPDYLAKIATFEK